MNAPLRRRHLLMWLFVGPLLILALGAALALRPAPQAVMDTPLPRAAP